MKLKKILVHYILRYFLGFMIVFMSSILVAAVAEKSIETYIIEAGIIKNQGGIDHIRETVAKMDLISQIMSENPSFTSLMYQKGQIPQTDVMKLKDANKMFVDIGFTADYIPYVFTLFKDNDMYLSTSQCSFQFENYFNKFLSVKKDGEEFTSSAAFRELLWERYRTHEPFFKLDQISFIHNEKEQTLYDPLIYVTAGDYTSLFPTSVFCFVIDSHSLVDDMVMSEMGGRGFLTIRSTRTGEELVRYGEVPPKEAECRDGENISSSESGEDTYRAIVNVQEELQWRIVTGVPLSYVDEQMAPVGDMLRTYLLAGLFLAVASTLYYSLRRYAGVRKVLSALHFGRTAELGKKGFDEYSLLKDNILKLEDKGNSYKMRVNELEKENQAILLEHLMVMGIRTPEERTVFETCFKKEPEFFCVALVRLYQKDYREFERVTLHLTEYVGRCYSGMVTHVYSGVSDELFLFELNPAQEANVAAIKNLLEDGAAALASLYDVVFHIGISAIGTDISNINKCYEQARQIVQAQFASQNENVVKAYDISVNALYDHPVNLEFLNRLHTLLICGQQSEVLAAVEKIEGYYERRPYLYEIQKEQIYYSLWNIFYTAGLHLGDEGKIMGSIPAMDRDMTCPDMAGLFKKSAVSICDYMTMSKKSKNDGLKIRIMEYLHTHFNDPGLSAAMVSSQVGISEKYLSQFIKEQTGETFSALLLNLRMEKAKEYLEETDYSNDEIARLTGFGSANTFYRNFNKQTGVSPKVYSESHKDLKNQ